MAFDIFANAIASGYPVEQPNIWYREIEQAFIDANWDNTTTLRTIQEQDIKDNQTDYYEDFTFSEIDAWVNSVVGQSSTGSKTGRDFVQLIFQDINHPKLEGRYYIVEGQYYISYFDNRVIDLDANLSVRRCNSWMKIVDPENGSIYQIPCVVDYDMSAPSNKVTNDIITPNNHAVVKVQQNAKTDRLFTTNKRFIFGGRPFKITGMQNATNQFINNPVSSLMEIDLFLDEIWDKDNLFDGVADNGTYDYKINLTSGDVNLINGSIGTLYANLTLNGKETTRVITWESSDDSVVKIDEMGNYSVVGEAGQEATIMATLYGNTDVFDSIKITVVEEEEAITDVSIDPSFTSIREMETLEVTVMGNYNNTLITPTSVEVNLPDNITKYLIKEINGNIVKFTCLKRYGSEVKIQFVVTCDSPAFTANKEISIKLTSLLG